MNLDELKKTRRTLLGAVAAAAQAVQHAKKQVEDELFEVQECERQREAARDRTTLDAALIALASARKDHALAIKRLEDRQGEHAHAEMRAHAAVAAVVRAVDQILTDELEERARQVERHLDEARRLGTTLRHFAIAAGIHSTGIVSDTTQGVLDRLGVPLADSHEMPIDLETLGDVAAFGDWVARRDRMISGDVPVPEDEAA